MQLTVSDLFRVGYSEHAVPSFKDGCTKFLQKAVRSPSGYGILYYINIYIYEFSYFPSGQGIEADVQFNINKPFQTTFNATILHPESVEHIDTFFEMMYNNLNCVPYERG